MISKLHLTIPGSCIQQIRLQRTQFKQHKDPRMAYAANIHRDWDEIKCHIPDDCQRVVDIGCGLAGIDVFLHYYFQSFLYLFDLDRMDTSPLYGMRDNPSVYCLHAQVREFLEANRVPTSGYRLDSEFPSQAEHIDLVISLLSWGFHYPISTYLEKVAKMLRPDGVLIIDLRSNVARDGIRLLRDAIGRVQYVVGKGKYVRAVFRRR